MNKIKEFRKNKGLTVRELAEKSNVANGYISDLENNKVNNPTKDVMEAVSSALGQTVPNVFYPEG